MKCSSKKHIYLWIVVCVLLSTYFGANTKIVHAEHTIYQLPVGKETQPTSTQVSSIVVHYLPYSPSVGRIRVNRTGILYQDYYTQLGFSSVQRDYCNGYSSSFCLGNNGEYHDYHDKFNYDRGAIDFRLPQGSAVLASAPGTVIRATAATSTAPAQISIRHADGTVSVYLHINNFRVNTTDKAIVQGGQHIADVGPKDSFSTGPHLHYALFFGGVEIKAKFSDADAKQYGSTEGYLLPSRTGYHESFYMSQNDGTNNPPAELSFSNGRSQITINSSSVNLQICADNLAGKRVYATVYRAASGGYPEIYRLVDTTTSSECVTFSDLDGTGDTFAGVSYYTVASLNPISVADGQNQRTSCYSATGGKQLCDSIQRVEANSLAFTGASSLLEITQTATNLNVCADNLLGKTVYVTLYRDSYAGYSSKIWRYQKIASSTCQSFSDMDGTGDTFSGVTYYTVASLNPISDSDAISKRNACYNVTGQKQLCDANQRGYSGTLFESGYSTLEITQAAVNLHVCAANLNGKSVKATLYRDAYNGYASKIWNYEKQANSNCVDFSDMDGVGDTFSGITYYTVSSLNIITDTDASSKRTSCYPATGGAQLCDSGGRGTTAPICYTLTTAANPVESGGVEVSPLNSDGCPAGSYKSGTTVTITAKPTSGYTFQSWSGATGGSMTTISITANKSLTANFSNAQYNTNWMPDSVFTGELNIEISQIRNFLSSQGSCLASPIQDSDGQIIDVPKLVYEASQRYDINPKVILATMQKEQSAITRCPSSTARAFLMGANVPSTARAQIDLGTKYFRDYLTELQNTGHTRSGWMVGIPKTTVDGVTVTPASRAVAALFTYTPYAGTVWGGNNNSIGGTQLFKSAWDLFKFDQPFAPPDCFMLNTFNTPEKGGMILASESPNCDGTKYIDGTELTLYADTDLGYDFSHWSGDVSSTNSWINLVMNSDLSVTSEYTQQPCYSLTASVLPSGSGKIQFDPLPNCSEDLYYENTEVTVTATAAGGFRFVNWEGDLVSNNHAEIMLINQNRTIRANFEIGNSFWSWIYLPMITR